MEEALKKFIEYWKSKKYVEGILLSGSYAVGLENENSDIDIRIIFNSKYKKSIKGLTVIDGYIFSYLGRSTNTTQKKIGIDFFNKNKFEARIFSIGIILYDKSKNTEKLVKIAKTYFGTPFIKKRIRDEEIKTNMYALYSSKIYLESLPENSSFFIYHYYNFLRQSIRFYSLFIGYEFFIDSKIEKILTDKMYRDTYSWEEFPDRNFIKIWIESLEFNNICKDSITLIYCYLENLIIKIDEKKFTITWYE